MAPVALPILPSIKDTVAPKKDTLGLPEAARKRFEKAGIDLSAGYPYRPAKPIYLDDVYNVRDHDRPFTDPGSRADPAKKALLSAATEVIHLTAHIGTEIKGLQLKDLTDRQKDELGLLIAERSVVFFRDQEITPQEQKKLGEWFGEIEVHVRCVSDFRACENCFVLIVTSLLAASSFSARRSRNYGHLASIAGHRSCTKLPKSRRRESMAYRSCTRKTAGR